MPEAAADLWDPSTDEDGVSPPQHGFTDVDGRSSHRRQRPAEADESTTNHLVHVAYRHSDLKSVHSRQQHQRQQQAPLGRFAGTDSLTAKVMNVGEGDSRYTDSDVSWSQKAEQQEDGDTKKKMEPQLNSKREQHHLAETEYPRRSLSESKTSRLPFVVENGARGAENWDTDPLGQYPECPSSPRVFQVGIAMDTGYFKVSQPVY